MFVFVCIIVIFFFKQKTAYEMLRSLVGSEMCIRDRTRGRGASPGHGGRALPTRTGVEQVVAAHLGVFELSLIHI